MNSRRRSDTTARAHDQAMAAPGCLVAFVSSWSLVAVGLGAADDARQIVEEAQRRTDAKSQRYEGLLQVFDAKGKISDKRWTFERLGVARRRARRCSASRRRPRSKASRCWSSIIPIARRISGCGRRRSSAIAGLRCRIARRGSSAPTSASRISRSATSISTTTRCSATRRSTARRAGRFESTPKQSEVVAVHAVDRLDSQGQLRVRADRELRQGPGRAAAGLLRHPERPGHLDRAAARDDRPRAAAAARG